jgi:hypothetical protein
VHEPQLIERSQIELLPDGAWAPYHATEGLDLADARESVRRSIRPRIVLRRAAYAKLRGASPRQVASRHVSSWRFASVGLCRDQDQAAHAIVAPGTSFCSLDMIRHKM